MAPSRGPLPTKAPQPTRVIFDPFNSSSTGHQRAENRLSSSTTWRESRQYKLAHQFRDRTGTGGPKHLSDHVGTGSENFGEDGRKENGDWEPGASGIRKSGWQDIRNLLGNSRKRPGESVQSNATAKKPRVDSEHTQPKPPYIASGQVNPEPFRSKKDDTAAQDIDSADTRSSEEHVSVGVDEKELPQIFRGLTMYLNGSTMPLISDYRLKQLWVQHGGVASISLRRRTVTHVILAEKGCGGGLASGKIQKENVTVRGRGVKYVTANWVLDSIEKGIRQPESGYAQAEVKNRLGGAGQTSVATLFRAKSD